MTAEIYGGEWMYRWEGFREWASGALDLRNADRLPERLHLSEDCDHHVDRTASGAEVVTFASQAETKIRAKIGVRFQSKTDRIAISDRRPSCRSYRQSTWRRARTNVDRDDGCGDASRSWQCSFKNKEQSLKRPFTTDMDSRRKRNCKNTEQNLKERAFENKHGFKYRI